METVERALGDLRVGSTVGAGRGGGRRGHSRHGEAKDIKVPTTDFDFQGSNAKFDKSAAGPRKSPKDAGEEETGPPDETKEKAYNPQSSFFDSLSSSTHSPPPTRGGGGGRGGGGRAVAGLEVEIGERKRESGMLLLLGNLVVLD